VDDGWASDGNKLQYLLGSFDSWPLMGNIVNLMQDNGWAQMVISYLLGSFDSWAPTGNIVNLVWMMAGHRW
jgi:hypothetical protein